MHGPSEGTRLHPSAIAIWVIDGVGRSILALIPLILFRPRWALAALGGIGLLAVASVIRYVRFRYRVEAGALILEGGVVGSWRRVIPLSHIQGVDVVQKLRHRAFGVLELRIEAAGGPQTEAALPAVRPEDGEALRARLLADTGPLPGDERVVPVLASIGPGRLAAAAITGSRVAVIAVMLGYAEDLVSERLVEQVVERLGQVGATGLLALVGVVVAFLVVSVAISVVATILVYWDFTLTREGDRLVVTRGLLEKRRAVVPLARLQAISMEENLLRLALGLASLKAVTAGFTGRSEDERETSFILPIASRSEAVTVASQVLGRSVEQTAGGLEDPPRRAVGPRVAWGTAIGLGAGSAAVLVWGRLGAIAFLLVPLGALLGVASWRALGHAVADGVAVVRWGLLVRRTMFVPLENLQQVSLRTRPLQRLLDLGTVKLDVPGGTARLIDLARDRAEQRFDLVAGVMTGPHR